MNWITRLFGKQEVKPKKPDWKNQLVKELKAWRPMGKTFQYCGRTLVVTNYWRSHFDGISVYTSVGIEADYADDLGVIHSIRFSASESRALMEQQP